jgi:hypothetical protein
MKVYTYSEARQNLASVLDRAVVEGEVPIKRRDGREYLIKPVERTGSPLDIDGIDLNLSTEDIVVFVRESRERGQET